MVISAVINLTLIGAAYCLEKKKLQNKPQQKRLLDYWQSGEW